MEQIYLECARFVWMSLQRLGVRHADVEDVCHDVFVIVQRKLPSFEPGGSIRPWLFGICARTAANYRRRAYIKLERSVAFAEYDFIAEAPESTQPDQEAQRHQSLSRAEAILSGMSPIKRAVFVMFEVEGLSCQQIASELDVPVGTVYSRLHAAREVFLKQAAPPAPPKGRVR